MDTTGGVGRRNGIGRVLVMARLFSRIAAAGLLAASCYAGGADLSPKAQQSFAGLRMVNWFPIDNWGTNMWINFDLSVVASDFAAISASGFNAVRIIVSATPDAFALPQPSQQMLGNLRDLVNAADQAGLKVQLTLFDQYFAYAQLQKAVSDGTTWINAVVRPFQNDPRIVYIDMRNEIDLSNPAQFAWLQAIFPLVKNAAGTIPVTASLNGLGTTLPAVMALLRSAAPVDLFDIHFYGEPQYALAQLGNVITAAGATPIYFGECGRQTDTDFGDASLPATKEAREAEQEKYFRALHAATRELGLPTPSPWTFDDASLSGVSPAVLGYWASVYNGSAAGAFYGLRRTDRTEKPALPTLRALNGGARISADVNEGFEAGDSSGMPLNWHVLSNPGAGSAANFAQDTSVAHSGAASARISNATGGATGTPSFWVDPVQPTHPGAQYRARVYAKGSNITGFVRLVLAWTDANFQFIGLVNSQSLPNGNSDWTLLNVSTQAPANAARLSIHLQSHENESGTAWFDDVVAGRIQTAVEFYAVTLDHYFISTDPAEIAALDSGAIKGWSRTGYSFNAYASMSIGTSPVCRFYIPPQYGDSHFFGRGVTECAATHAKFPVFDYESEEVFAMELPVNGICGGATIPVYRVFDNRADANHRYTTDRSVRDAMVAKGWIAEGDGPDAVVMCAPS